MSSLDVTPPPPSIIDPDSLTFVLEYLSSHDDYDDAIYAFLAPVDTAKLQQIVERLERVEGFDTKKANESTRRFNGRKSVAKGKIYERLVTKLCEGIQAFEARRDVTTELNQLDVLITLGSLAYNSAPLKHWGSHCICECKFHSGGFKGDWLHKLQSVLQLHNAKVGLLFSRKGISNTGQGAGLRTKLQFMAGRPPYNVILTVDWDDLKQCAGGANFLKLLNQKYVETMTGVARLELLSE